nr:hypothetical protein [Tanacetum cinerariifolium]
TDIKRMDTDDQAIQTILLSLPKDVYAAVDSCETAKEIWERVRQMMKGSDIGEQEKKAKLLMNDLKRNKHFPENIASYLKFLNNIQPEWKRHVTIVRQIKNLHETNFTQIYDFLKMNQEEDRLTQNVEGNGGNQFGQYAGQVAQNQQGFNAWQNGGIQGVQNVGVQSGGNQNGLLLIAQKEEAGIQLQAEEFDFMAAAGDLDEIEEVNANCILMANLQQSSTSGTQHDRAPVYDTDGSAEVQLNDNCYNNEIFLMFTQEEQYTNLLEPIPEPQLVPQNDNHVTSVAPKKSSISSLMDEKKRLKHDFKIREDKFLDKEVDLEAIIKDLENILLKRDQTVQTIHMLNPEPDSFYHPN